MVASSPAAAVANGRKVSTYTPSGMCQKYVRAQCWQVGSLYGSAIDAWNGAKWKHPGDRNPPTGAPVYYRGGKYGHAVISVGGGRVRSTDTTSATKVGEQDIGYYERAWGYAYLGWTEDINGVRVMPKGSTGGGGGSSSGKDEDMPLTDDDVSKIAKRVNQVLGDFNASGQQRDAKNKDPEQANRRLNEIENVVRQIKAKVDKL